MTDLSLTSDDDATLKASSSFQQRDIEALALHDNLRHSEASPLHFPDQHCLFTDINLNLSTASHPDAPTDTSANHAVTS